MAKVKRNDNFDISLLAYTGESRNIFKIKTKLGHNEITLHFSNDNVSTLCTDRKEEEFYFGMSRGKVESSRRKVLNEPGMSFR